MSYTMLPEKIIGRWGSTVVTGYGMLIGGIFLFFATRYWTVRVTFDLGTVLGLAAIVLIGTALSFTLYLQASVISAPSKPACWRASNRFQQPLSPLCGWAPTLP